MGVLGAVRQQADRNSTGMGIITSSSDEKLARAKKLGANRGINYKTTPDWEKAAMRSKMALLIDFGLAASRTQLAKL